MVTHTGRKVSGGKYRPQRKRKLTERIQKPRLVLLGEERKKQLRVRGGKFKTILLRANKACVSDKGKTRVVRILKVLEVPSNQLLARKGVLVKGAIIETEAGKAKITNRPGKAGQVQAKLIE